MSDLFAYIDRTEPDSPTSMTMTPTASVAPSGTEDPSSQSQSLPELKDRGRGIYKDVWTEFYDWEADYCVEILGTVTQSFVASKRQVARVAKAMVTRLLDDALAEVPKAKRPTTADGSETDDAETMVVTNFVSGGRKTTTAVLSLPVITVEAYPPHPQYESCSPISRSILMDTVYEHTLPFMPYADDASFPAKQYQARFECLEWETPFDPDVEMIQIETVRRLHNKHDIDIQDIDRMGMFKELRCSHNTGLLWDQSQRDVLHWPGAFRFQAPQEEQLPNYTPNTDDLRQRLMSNLRIFCPSINCLHSVCETHGQKHTSSYIPSRKPQLTAQDMILSEGTPCGPDCFRHIQDFDRFMETLPPSPNRQHHTGSLDTLETVLGIAPDLFPCELAIICLKPCKEIFVQRQQLFPDHSILSGSSSTDADNEGERRRTRKKPNFLDLDSVFCHVLLPACSHPGSCSSNQCPCYVKKQHCSLMCRCGVKCERQWPSCNCTNGKCVPKTCACAKKMRECIPGICMKCNAGGQNGRPCNNTKMQSLTSKPIEIKIGKYGLGAFACQTMQPNTFLGSYVGHILTEELANHTNELAKHTTRNYMFEVTPDTDDIQSLMLFDAAHLGNATRFLNHMEDDQSNVEAKNVFVIGEHQIGFFTRKKVRAGEELFLDYGQNFWKAGK